MQYGISLFKRIPVLRFLVPLMVGIICQFYYQITLTTAIIAISFSMVLLCSYLLLNHANKFRFIWVNGIAITLLFFGVGNAVSFIKNSQHYPLYVGNYYTAGSPVIVTLQEPLVTKPKSYKALANIDAVLVNGKWHQKTQNRDAFK